MEDYEREINEILGKSNEKQRAPLVNKLAIIGIIAFIIIFVYSSGFLNSTPQFTASVNATWVGLLNIHFIGSISGNVELSDSNGTRVYSGSITSDILHLLLNSGDYSLVAGSDFTYSLVPEKFNRTVFATGIASYGVISNSGQLSAYQIQTSEVLGIASISKIKAYNATLPDDLSPNTAGLQLNVVANVSYDGTKDEVFWLQDVAQFDTSSNSYYLDDNIWNSSAPDANISSSLITGSGKVTLYSNPKGATQNVYAYATGNIINANLPINITLIIKTYIVNGSPMVSFGYAKGFTVTDGKISYEPHFYDNVSLNVNATNISIIVTPYYVAPSFIPYDAEFVFGGPGDGASTYFESLDADLSLLYYNNTVNSLSYFPSYYNFGEDTAEAGDNLQTSVLAGSFANVSVTTGTPNYGYLSNNQSSKKKSESS